VAAEICVNFLRHKNCINENYRAEFAGEVTHDLPKIFDCCHLALAGRPKPSLLVLKVEVAVAVDWAAKGSEGFCEAVERKGIDYASHSNLV
jgi:hypothetical protein